LLCARSAISYRWWPVQVKTCESLVNSSEWRFK
jgi:hypothetical protein